MSFERTIAALLPSSLLVLACSSEALPSAAGTPAHGGAPNTPAMSEAGQAGSVTGAEGGAAGSEAVTLRVPVAADAVTYVKLATPAVVDVGEPGQSLDWDLAFSGYDVLTNSGVSGPGSGGGFGPLDVAYFAFADEAVDVPFIVQDYAAGALFDWYVYDGATHHLYSRFHTYGVRSGAALYKLQLESYYGGSPDAPASALYSLRYAQVTSAGSGKTVELTGVDATLGNPPDAAAPGACLTLATGDVTTLTAAESLASTQWDLCLRRDAINVNGERGGPGHVTAVDLDAGSSETLAELAARTPASEEARFDAVDRAALTAPGLVYRGDRAASVFSGAWLEPAADPPAPRASVAFLVLGADGSSRYLLAFRRFEGASASAPGTIELRVHPLVTP